MLHYADGTDSGSFIIMEYLDMSGRADAALFGRRMAGVRISHFVFPFATADCSPFGSAHVCACITGCVLPLTSRDAFGRACCQGGQRGVIRIRRAEHDRRHSAAQRLVERLGRLLQRAAYRPPGEAPRAQL